MDGEFPRRRLHPKRSFYKRRRRQQLSCSFHSSKRGKAGVEVEIRQSVLAATSSCQEVTNEVQDFVNPKQHSNSRGFSSTLL